MDLNKSNLQLRKGDPIAQMNNAENKNHIANQSNANQFLGYNATIYEHSVWIATIDAHKTLK